MTKVEVGRDSSSIKLGRVRIVGLSDGPASRMEWRVLLREMWAWREVRLAWKGARAESFIVACLML